ncbi:PLP-dependent aminotransferase family protein [Kocuria sp.]|uniref:aminotransferase-like domain-containing protein n=1 Tax=Kocuria sp. TaxID=1871328 RepID=UPI0025BD6E68|nr:PLP-dependent aminotransferase family protein [Kocuria sp.]
MTITPHVTTVRSLDPRPTAGVSGPAAQGLLPLASRSDGLVGSVIDSSTSLLAVQTHDIVRFAMGAPAAEVIPTEEFRRIAGEILTDASFTYGATEGKPDLIDTVVNHFSDSASDPERIVITSGGMQGLDLAFKLFVDPGDLVVVESPTYTNGSGTALSYGADVLEVPVDDDGMDVDALETLVAETGRTPRMIYTIPNFQNPSGTTLSESRRRRLLDLAHTWGAMILDDDPYGELRFSGDPVPGFHELSPDDPLVFSVRTFSKILAPGLRVGWVDADPRLRELLIAGKQAMDTCANVPAQHIVAEYIARGGYDEHLVGLRTEYKRRKEAMDASIAAHLGDRVRTTDPDGGFFLWVTLQGDDARVSSSRLFEIALAEGDAFRLCFASSTPERIEEGLQRLARALDIARGELDR